MKASGSLEQLLFLLGVRPERSGLLLAGGRSEEVALRDWGALIGLRENVAPRRILYDLPPASKDFLARSLPGRPYSVKAAFDGPRRGEEGRWLEMVVAGTPWVKEAWRVVQFMNPEFILSTIITSDRYCFIFLGLIKKNYLY